MPQLFRDDRGVPLYPWIQRNRALLYNKRIFYVIATPNMQIGRGSGSALTPVGDVVRNYKYGHVTGSEGAAYKRLYDYTRVYLKQGGARLCYIWGSKADNEQMRSLGVKVMMPRDTTVYRMEQDVKSKLNFTDEFVRTTLNRILNAVQTRARVHVERATAFRKQSARSGGSSAPPAPQDEEEASSLANPFRTHRSNPNDPLYVGLRRTTKVYVIPKPVKYHELDLDPSSNSDSEFQPSSSDSTTDDDDGGAGAGAKRKKPQKKGKGKTGSNKKKPSGGGGKSGGGGSSGGVISINTGKT